MGSASYKVTIAFQLVFLLVICGFNATCNGQDKKVKNDTLPRHQEDRRQKKSDMESFDVDAYAKKLKENPDYEGYHTKEGVEVSEYYMPDQQAPSDTFNKQWVQSYTRIEERPDGYRTAYQFDRNGRQISVAYYFSTALEIGKWQKFDSTGKITEEVDKDASFPFSLEKVIAFGKAHKVDFAKTGRLRRGYDSTYKADVWNLRWVADAQGGEPYQQIYILDGGTGRILKEDREGPPQRI